jgi:DNA-directed RNA polymerase subunit L
MSKKKTSEKKKPDDMVDDMHIDIIEQSKINDSYNNYLILSLVGGGINNIVLNTIRRVIIELVPTYAYEKNDIIITKNNSIFDNDYVRIRISQMPIFNIENKFDTIKRVPELEYEANVSMFEKKIEDLTIIQQKEDTIKAEKSQNFTMSIDAHNTSNEILNLMTDHPSVKFYYNAKIFESPYKKPLLIIKLKPGEDFVCTATSTLNIGLHGPNFMPNSVCVFGEPTADKQYYMFNIESLKQLTEKELMIRSCAIIDDKLNHFLNIIPSKIIEYKIDNTGDQYNLEDKQNDDTKDSTDSDSITRETSENVLEIHHIKGVIEIENESHTFGNLLTRFIQDHPAILYAAYKIDHPLIKKLSIGYKTDGTDIVTVIKESINDAKNVFAKIRKHLEMLSD